MYPGAEGERLRYPEKGLGPRWDGKQDVMENHQRNMRRGPGGSRRGEAFGM